jgi:hypothetical protein
MNTERLLKLADGLETLPDKVWDYRRIMKRGTKSPKDALLAGGGCGTVGCAVGWSPAFFPELTWTEHMLVTFADREQDDADSFETIRKFFELHSEETELLFEPHVNRKDEVDEDEGNWEDRLGTDQLPWDVTAKDVARHIRKFVELHA